MIVLLARYHVKDGNVAAVFQALQRMKAEMAASEPECVTYQVSVSTEIPNLALLYEVYTNEAALLAHRETPHFKAIIEGEIIPMLDRRERETFELRLS